MSWRDYADLLESGNAEPGAWGSARQANPNNAHDALVSALHSTDPHATAETILALVAEVERLRAELAQTRQMVGAAREGGRIGLAREWQPVAEALTRLEMAFTSVRGNYTKELEDLLDLWATVP